MVEHSSPAHHLADMTCYLNNAGQARLSPAVKQAGVEAISAEFFADAANDQLRVRELFGALVGAEASAITLHPSTAFAMTMAGENIRRTTIGSGRIVVLEDQFNSAVYAWQSVVARSQGRLRLDIVPYPETTGNWTLSIFDCLQDDTKEPVVATCLPPLHWSDGALVDLVAIGQYCRAAGIALLVDATQAVGIMDFGTIAEIQPAMLCASVHKWLRSPSGTALVYIDPTLHDTWEPLDQHERGRPGDAERDAMRHQMTPEGYPTESFPDARKFVSGGKPNPILLPMMRVALRQVLEVDRLAAQARLKQLVTPVLQWATARGWVVPLAPHAYHIIGIRPPSMTPEQLLAIGAQLAAEHIYVAVRCGGFRISPYLDTTEEEMERLLDALERLAVK